MWGFGLQKGNGMGVGGYVPSIPDETSLGLVPQDTPLSTKTNICPSGELRIYYKATYVKTTY